jgi:hypothetical protein
VPKLGVFSGDEVCRILESHGFHRVRQKGVSQHFLTTAHGRTRWLKTEEGFRVAGLQDSAEVCRRYMRLLEAKARQSPNAPRSQGSRRLSREGLWQLKLAPERPRNSCWAAALGKTRLAISFTRSRRRLWAKEAPTRTPSSGKK